MPRRATPISPGVLNEVQIRQLVTDDAICPDRLPNLDIGASAFDLPIGSKAWRLREGQRPTTRELDKIKHQSEAIELKTDEKGQYFEFDARQIYLVQLDPYLKLPQNISGRATGKSSIGRLDIITRLITTGSKEYDVVAGGYDGNLHVLLLPQTFSVRIAPGGSVNQLRLFSGPPSASVISRDLARSYGTDLWHVLKSGSVDDYENWDELLPARLAVADDPQLFDLTVDLHDPACPYVFEARQSIDSPIDLRRGDYDPAQFFAKVAVTREGPDRSVVLQTGRFYIMKSRERLSIPKDIAVEVVAISERIGDIRIHYAGFAHPGFGLTERPDHKRGTPLIFEVRATDMPTKLYHESTLARIQLFRMSREADPKSSPYDSQELKLSNVFRQWPSEER